MRVIAGELRGRRLIAPAGLAVRPTPDRVREALFDILGETVRGARFLDLFAGSGAIGIEAFSRGADAVVLVESDSGALKSLDKNLQALGITDRVSVQRTPWPAGAEHAARIGGPFGIVFADPPFDRAPYPEILLSLSRTGILGEDATVVLEHEVRAGTPPEGGSLHRYRVAAYGRVALAFYGQGR